MNLISEHLPESRKFPRQTSASEPAQPRSNTNESALKRRRRHYTPVWIVLVFLLPCIALTIYYARYGLSGPLLPDSILPSPSYALVLFLVYLDSVGLVVFAIDGAPQLCPM